MTEHLRRAVLIIAICLLSLITVRLIVIDIRDIRSSILPTVPVQPPSHIFRNWRTVQRPLTAHDVVFIREWMTFNYLNRVFRLPGDSLKTALGIHDDDYPNITIQTAAHDVKADPKVYLETVKEAIRRQLSDPSRP